MSDLILASDNGIITPAANAIVNMGENDPFQIVFRPAKPTLDAVRWLRPCFRFIDACSRRGRPLFREQEAAKMVAKLPTVEKLAEAGKLFDAAVTEKAPSSWVHAVLALMADSQPNPSTSDGWRFGLADSLCHDPDGRRYSPPVIVQAIREARRTIDGLPTAAAFLKICEAQRDRFWEWSEDVDMLIELRRQAEDYLAAENRKLIPAPEPGDDAWSSIGYRGRA